MRKELLELSQEIIAKLLNERGVAHEFESLGIKDGEKIIQEYVQNNEVGLACDHLEYIISECDIVLSKSQEERISLITKKFK